MFNLRNERPGVEVLVASPSELDGAVDHFRPHLVVCNTVTRKVRGSVPCWIEVLVRKNLDANVSVYGQTSTLENVETKNLLQIMDEVECGLASAT